MENFDPPEDVKTKITPFASYPVIAPGIHTDLFRAYESVLRVKQVADIIIPLHDPDMAERDQIPWQVDYFPCYNKSFNGTIEKR